MNDMKKFMKLFEKNVYYDTSMWLGCLEDNVQTIADLAQFLLHDLFVNRENYRYYKRNVPEFIDLAKEFAHNKKASRTKIVLKCYRKKHWGYSTYHVKISIKEDSD